MPFYEYECQNCKFYTEVLQKISDAPLRKCPSCGKSQLKKLVSAPVFRLKGGGWYETDFKTDKEGKRNLATDKEPDSVSESKPAVKATDAKAADAKLGDSKPAESKPAAAESSGAKASESKSSEPSAASRGARKGSSGSRPAVAAKKAASKSKSKAAPARRKRR
jgi:putative FmdB family regulatory protein